MTSNRRGFTLFELLIAIGILAMISILIYGAFSSMQRSKQGLERLQDRYREGRLAMQRVSRELQSAYLSLHVPDNQTLVVQKTAFVGARGIPADRVDFNTFANIRRDRDSHTSDQAEISYFGSQDPEHGGTVDLVRRASDRPDVEPGRGGRVEILATNIDLFDLEYLDATTDRFTDTWDSTTTTGQPGRLPLLVRITLVLNEGQRGRSDSGRNKIRLLTTVRLPIQKPLNFALL
jgi:general secretion pathway protein J